MQAFVVKLGLVRFATSFLVVLLGTVLNRVLIADLKVPATLVTFSFAFQHVMSPVGLITGYFSDGYAFRGRHRAPYIWGGMLLSLAVMPFFPHWARALGGNSHSLPLLLEGILLFALFGIGTTVSATAVNALLVDRLEERERGGALTVVWILTVAGAIAGSLIISFILPSYDPEDLQRTFGQVSLLVLVITAWGAWKVEPPSCTIRPPSEEPLDLQASLRHLAGNLQALVFFLFSAASMFFLALRNFLLAPFGAEVLALDVAQTSRFMAYVEYGVFVGMVGLHLLWSFRRQLGDKTVLTVSLTVGALALGVLGLTSFWPHHLWGVAALWLLGLSRGLYNVGISHLIMRVVHPRFSGTFMGLWNLASGLALALGGMAGGLCRDLLFSWSGSAKAAYGWVFLLEGLGLFSCLVFLIPLKVGRYQPRLALYLDGAPGQAASMRTEIRARGNPHGPR